MWSWFGRFWINSKALLRSLWEGNSYFWLQAFWRRWAGVHQRWHISGDLKNEYNSKFFPFFITSHEYYHQHHYILSSWSLLLHKSRKKISSGHPFRNWRGLHRRRIGRNHGWGRFQPFCTQKSLMEPSFVTLWSFCLAAACNTVIIWREPPPPTLGYLINVRPLKFVG